MEEFYIDIPPLDEMDSEIACRPNVNDDSERNGSGSRSLLSNRRYDANGIEVGNINGRSHINRLYERRREGICST